MRTIETANLIVNNEFDVRGQALLGLIKAYIPGIRGRYYGFKPLGANDITFPAIFLEPSGQTFQMITLAKYEIKITFDLFFFVVENDPADCATLATSLAESLLKLLSNNATNDLGLANPPSNRFKAYPPYWNSSEIVGDVSISNAFQNANPNGPKLMRAGRMRFVIEDQIIK